MAFIDDIRTALDAVAVGVGRVEASELPSTVSSLTDAALETLIRDAAALAHGAECVIAAASGVVDARSARDRGQGGMAQIRGHRNAVSLIQDLTGTTRATATKQVRLGEALLAAAVEPPPVTDHGDDPVDGADGTAERDAGWCVVRPWHASLGDAVLAGALRPDQHDAIRRGLGEPPAGDTGDSGDAQDDVNRAAWAAAAVQLIDEAAERTVEELAAAARTVRDLLDPVAAAARFDQRYQRRSFRMWVDDHGGYHARIDFDDEMAASVRAIIDSALRPRRGGPRFVDAAEAARAAELEQDPRSNDQLTYDLMMDVVRAGALADAQTVFGTRQAGIRVVVTADAADTARAGGDAVAVVEDDSTALPAWLAGQRACDTGMTVCTVDTEGNPLDVGREQRLFTPKQRIALAIRDGGCRWPGCDRPASYCEAHHCDSWASGGTTDIDRGILLCRHHHMNLHHHGWRIAREGKGAFVLHCPPGQGSPRSLEARLTRRYAFGDLAPPPARFRPAVA